MIGHIHQFCALCTVAYARKPLNGRVLNPNSDGNHIPSFCMSACRSTYVMRVPIKQSVFQSGTISLPSLNAPTYPCGLRGLPSWAWQNCNRLLMLRNALIKFLIFVRPSLCLSIFRDASARLPLEGISVKFK